MGNCQAVDAAVLVIQHPCGKIDRLYWPVTASEIMRTNPGHYVSLIIPLPLQDHNHNTNQDHHHHHHHKTVRFTRVKLLRPNETLNLGHAYRLITTQEVMKVLKAKKNTKSRKTQAADAVHNKTSGESDTPNTYQGMRADRQRPVNPASLRSKSWRPSLQSISESAT
ncbi:hypothetical protein PIB30_015783 [Stylosanthes scabra]|uniref:Uncharacterized protein n=1 Tax=Stylosanthes scabra TaxID=79078 RepID=A0ABU6Z6M6_9FABA|nr:hypothetical protein [Stylosanthes scabra]